MTAQKARMEHENHTIGENTKKSQTDSLVLLEKLEDTRLLNEKAQKDLVSLSST
jgi:hypothetical protein